MTDEAEAMTAMGTTAAGTTAAGPGPARTSGPRIVIVGAGGWVFPVELTRDILSFPALSGCTLVLYDIDAAAAAKTARAAGQLIELGGLAARVEIPADLPTALRGADFVLTVFQVGGVQAYAHDLLIPREYGIDPGRYAELLPVMASQALASGSPANNPRVPTTDELIELYRRVYG